MARAYSYPAQDGTLVHVLISFNPDLIDPIFGHIILRQLGHVEQLGLHKSHKSKQQNKQTRAQNKPTYKYRNFAKIPHKNTKNEKFRPIEVIEKRTYHAIFTAIVKKVSSGKNFLIFFLFSRA